jgi:hypothetical protein
LAINLMDLSHALLFTNLPIAGNFRRLGLYKTIYH